MKCAFLCFTLTLLAAVAGFSQSFASSDTEGEVNPNTVIGIWLSENGNEKIEIYKRGDNYYGTISWMKEEHDENGLLKTDSHNPEPSLRGRPMVGIEILYGFEYRGNGVFNKGRIYDPSTGNTYKARIVIVNNKVAKVRGYIGIPLIGRSEICTKIQ